MGNRDELYICKVTKTHFSVIDITKIHESYRKKRRGKRDERGRERERGGEEKGRHEVERQRVNGLGGQLVIVVNGRK